MSVVDDICMESLDERVYVAESGIHGRGLFAKRALRAGEYIGRYEGESTDEDGMHVLWLWDEQSEQWTGVDGQNALRFLNHSDTPNADWGHPDEDPSEHGGSLDLYALSDIAADEEITFDYAWDEDE